AVRDGLQPRLRLRRNALLRPRGAIRPWGLWLRRADREVRLSLVRGATARRADRNGGWCRDRVVRNPVAGHLLRDGDARAIAGRLLHRLPVHLADRRRGWPARRQCAFDLILWLRA